MLQIEELRKRYYEGGEDIDEEAKSLLFGPVADLLRECEGVISEVVNHGDGKFLCLPHERDGDCARRCILETTTKARSVLSKLKGA